MAHVTTPDGDTVNFKLLAGIMQGDNLYCNIIYNYLVFKIFNTAINRALNQIMNIQNVIKS